jgi:predicted tellurium resistance membrane protein TerC
MDLSVFATPEAWISLVTLMFLEIVLGVDNLVFIVLTTDRLPPEKQHIGRRLGLLGALVSRCIFLCFASFLVRMTDKLFTIPGLYLNGAEFGLSVRDLVLLLGGLYLIYKGIAELRDVLNLTEEKEGQGDAEKPRKTIGLVGAVATIMVMDVVFSIDSVITAVGLANHLIVMIIAVMLAVILMMVFIDTISDFINAHTEMKILALVFITVIGVLLALDGLGINSGIEVFDMHAEKLMVYFAMVFAVVLEVIQMRYNKNFQEWTAQKNLEMMRARGFDPQNTDTLQLANALLEAQELKEDEQREK